MAPTSSLLAGIMRRFGAERRDRSMLTFGDRVVTWGAMAERTNRVACGLRTGRATNAASTDRWRIGPDRVHGGTPAAATLGPGGRLDAMTGLVQG